MADFARLLSEMISERDKLNVAIMAITELQKRGVLTPKPRGRPPGSLNKVKPKDENLPDAKI